MKPQACRLRAASLGIVLSFWAVAGWSQPAGGGGSPPEAADFFEPADLTGTIYAKSDGAGEVLFTFRRTAVRSGSTVRVLREYFGRDGVVAARERVVYEAGQLRSFQLEEPPSGTSGSGQVQPHPSNPKQHVIAFEYTQDSRTKTGRERLEADTLVNDMMGPFVASHWSSLMQGKAVKFRYVAVARSETVGFKFVKDSETAWRGKPAVVIRMEPTSWIIARLVDPLYFTVEADGRHRILQYVGRTTPRIRKGSSWEDVDALTVFDWK